MNTVPIRILYVDAETTPSFSDVQSDQPPLSTTTASTASEAISAVTEGGIDCIVCETDIEGAEWGVLLDAVREFDETVPFVLRTDDSDEIRRLSDKPATDHVLEGESRTDKRIVERVRATVDRDGVEADDEFFRDLVENAPGAILTVDTSSAIVFANDAVERIFGYDPDELVGQSLLTLIPKESHSAGMEQYLETGERPLDWDYIELPAKHRDGSNLTIGVSFREFRRGGRHLFIGIVRDVTQRKHRERELQQSQRRFDALFHDPDTFIGLLETDGTVMQVNRTALEFVGREHSAVVDKPFWDGPWWEHSEQLQAEVRGWIEEAATGESVRYEADHFNDTGDRVTIDGLIRPVTDDNGDIVSLLVAGRDITVRAMIKEELQASEHSLRQLYDVTSDPSLSFEAKLEQILEIGRQRLGLSLGFLTRIAEGNQRIITVKGEHDVLRTGAETSLEQAYCKATIQADGLVGVENASGDDRITEEAYDTFGLQCYLGGKVLVDGNLYGTFCFADGESSREAPFSDSERTFVELLTQWTSHELERERRESELQEKNKQLEEFASVVSHDLRNPLSVALGNVELLREEIDRKELDDVAASLDQIDRLIDDLLTLARQGDSIGEQSVVPLSSVAEQAWATTEATEMGELVFDDPPKFRADVSRTRQLFENLFRNSFEHGGDSVTVTVGGLKDGFYVADDGPGIPEGVRDTVFDSGYTTDEDGTGFGLSIVEGIAEGHGWKIDVTKSETGGARFEITGVEFA